MFSLQMRMWLLLTALFAIIYALITMIGTSMGIQNFYFYLIISVGMMFVQYMIGPKMVEWSMHVRYVKDRSEYPELWDMIQDQARQARVPMPRVCISQISIPNAFAFGRGINDGRVCVTHGIMDLLNPEELKAVIGHEMTHIRNRDVLTITMLSVIPIIMYRIAWHFMFYGNRRRDGNQSSGVAIGMVALIFYFVSNLLVMYASRIREYFADKGSVEFGNRPEALASALYKLVYGSARAGKDSIKEAEGMKAFFLNDPSIALDEIKELRQLDTDNNGIIDQSELSRIRGLNLKLGAGEKMMELMSTHPNMLKRIKHLATLSRT
jgi:heat shock protein HtpX